MSYLIERLAEMRRHLDHLRTLRPRVSGPAALERDLSLHNDVLFSLLTLCQLLIDIAGEISARRGERFDDYTDAVRKLAADDRFSADLVESLRPLPGFRNVLVHDYVGLDLERVVEALDRLEPLETFIDVVQRLIAENES